MKKFCYIVNLRNLIRMLELDHGSIFINSIRVGCKKCLIIIEDNFPLQENSFPHSFHSLYKEIDICGYKLLTCESKLFQSKSIYSI